MAKKMKKLLTLEQLVRFCEQNKFHNFSSKDTGYTLSVQVPGNLNFSDKEDEDLLYTTVKVCHTLLNRNGSYISEKNMKKAMPTLKYKPLLASIVEDENGELDFNGHDMEFNDDGTVNYIEKQIGTFTVDEPYLEYDKEQDKTYVMATAVIPREYTPSASIIEKKNGTKVSCELRINEMNYNVKEKYLELTDFVFSGVCCLGESVGEGMLGSRLDITDFSTANNSLCYEENEELLNEIKKLNENLSRFSIENSKKGGQAVEINEVVEEVTELMEETPEVAEEVVEETTEEEVTDTVVEDTVEEAPDEVVDEAIEETTEFTENVEEVVEETVEETTEEVNPNSIEYSVNGKNFAVSLDDIQYALNSLVNDTYSEQDGCYYATTVYEDHLVMIDYWTGKAYRQSYKKRKDSYSLTGDRVAVKSCWLTADEEKAIDDMRANYSVIESQLKEYQYNELHTQKENVLNSEQFAVLLEKDEKGEFKNSAFAELVSNMDNYSLTDLEKEAKVILADHLINGGNFALNTETTQKNATKFQFSSTDNKPKSKAYGTLFN